MVWGQPADGGGGGSTTVERPVLRRVTPHRDVPARATRVETPRDDVDRRNPAVRVLLATMPFALVLAGYAVAGALSSVYEAGQAADAVNALGATLRVDQPIAFDLWLFGELPTVWLQEHLYVPGDPRWYDALVAVVYLSHFLVAPGIAVVLWARQRERFKVWVGCVLALATVGLVTYVLYPMAPPWMAAELGRTEPVARISGLGWDVLHLGAAGELVTGGQGLSNPVAAMPSLHVGLAVLCAAFLMLGRTRRQGVLLALYPLAMTLAVVYSGEHYVVDALVGAAYAVAVVLVARLVLARVVDRSRERETAAQ